MESESKTCRDLPQGVSARLDTLRSGAPDEMKSFGEPGRFAPDPPNC